MPVSLKQERNVHHQRNKLNPFSLLLVRWECALLPSLVLECELSYLCGDGCALSPLSFVFETEATLAFP